VVLALVLFETLEKPQEKIGRQFLFSGDLKDCIMRLDA
jgi:hypothetical protein